MPPKPTDASPLVLTEAQGDAHIGACEPLSSQGSSRASRTLNMSPPSFYSGKHFRHMKCADPLTARMEGQREMEATEEEGLVSWLWAQQQGPFPPAWGVGVGASPQGGECRAASSPSPGLGPPLCRHRRPMSNVEPEGSKSCAYPHTGEKPLQQPGGRTGCAGRAPQGPPRTQASRAVGLAAAPRDSPRGHALGGTCPENPGPWRKEGRTLRTLLLPPGYKATRHHGTQGSRKGPRSSLCTPNTGRA